MLPQPVDALFVSAGCFVWNLVLARRMARAIAGHERVPVHFSIDLNPDGWGPRKLAPVIFPVVQAVLTVLVLALSASGLPTHGNVAGGLRIAYYTFAAIGAGGQYLYLALLRRWLAGAGPSSPG